MMREKGTLYLNMLHLILHGLPAAGKTCAKLKLTGQKLTGRKRAERKDGKLVYPIDDGAWYSIDVLLTKWQVGYCSAAAANNFRASERSCIVNTIIQMYVIQAMYCTCYEHAISP